MSQVQLELAKLKELEEKAKPIILAIQHEIDESAKEMATQNAEHQKRKEELELGKKLALKSFEEKYQKENAELESKNWERNANFAKEMTNLKEQLKDKISWTQVDLVMGKKQPRDIVSLNPELISPMAYPKGNSWKLAKPKNKISVSMDGLYATSNAKGWQSVSAEKGFHIFPDISGPVNFYFEITNMSSYQGQLVGLSSANMPDGTYVGYLPNSYAIPSGHDYCWLSGIEHPFEWPNGATKPKWNWNGTDVIGCGILLSPKNKLLIFFTGNGILMGKPIPINSTANLLYPTVSMSGHVPVWANFGDDSAKPFKYDINKCPGMIFE